VEIERAALVIVDLQNGFITESSAPVVPRIARMARRWIAGGGATILSRYFNHPNSQFERLLGWTSVRQPPETDLVDDLRPLAADVHAIVDKTAYSVFTDDGADLIAKGGWTDLFLCGLDTDTCVLKSLVDAFERGYTPWLVKDLCASHSGRGHHRAALTMAGRFIGINQLIRARDVSRMLGLPRAG
jgi:nicotinamidase-related amidase